MLNPESRKYIKLLKNAKRTICGFNMNRYGEAVVTTGIPREFKPDIITYLDQETTSYEKYILSKQPKKRR